MGLHYGALIGSAAMLIPCQIIDALPTARKHDGLQIATWPSRTSGLCSRWLALEQKADTTYALGWILAIPESYCVAQSSDFGGDCLIRDG